jgi:hypothetical protein
VAVGYQAAYSNMTGQHTVVGKGSLYYTTVSTGNAILGYDCIISGSATTNVQYNTAIGNTSLQTLQNGATYNTAVGFGSGSAITTGARNTIIGTYTGNQNSLDIRTASNYIVLSDGDGNPRQIINGSGQWIIGDTTSPLNSGGAKASIAFAGGQGLFIATNGQGNGQVAGFNYNLTTNVGSINITGSATSYATSSDYRLKENVVPMTGALDKISQLKPCTYVWKSTGEASQGFIAHELQDVVPECVTGKKDAVNEDGSIKPQGIDTSFLVATLTAAIQELKAEVDALKSQLNQGA